MEELCRSWMQPVPESRDPRPVFPIEVMQPIDSTLSKMRDIDQRSREAVNHVRNQAMHPLPPRVTGVPQAGRTSTPNGQYAYPPPPQMSPQGLGGTQNLPYQSHPRPFSHPVRSPAPPNLPSPVRHGGMEMAQPYQPPQSPPSQGKNAVNYVYTGPPPPKLSHQDRLEKLRYDVGGLLDSVRAHLALYPHDQEKLKLVQNLQSLKALIDTGSLSLTHIQSTEIVVANIARDLPFRPPTIPVHAPAPQPSPQIFDPSIIASILARGTTQPALSQPPAPQTYAPPPPMMPTPQFSSAYPATAPPQPPVGIPPASMSHLMSIMKPITPPSVSASPTPAAVRSGMSLLDQLRSSGLLGATPTQSTPVQAPAAASILSQLMRPQAGAQAMNDVKLEATSLKM
jgi:pre-mRNA cleavage complex 2 protein Pcf11